MGGRKEINTRGEEVRRYESVTYGTKHDYLMKFYIAITSMAKILPGKTRQSGLE